MTVIEKNTLNGANKIALMKHKHRYVVLVKSTHMDGANTVATMYRTPMSNPNGLLGQKSCRYLNQGCTFDNILMRAAH